MKSLASTLCLAGLIIATAPAQDAAKQRLEQSPRHGEWATISSGGRDLKCFIVYPEVKAKAPAVVVIHEIFGLTDWVRSVCDRLAENGVIAIAPDFLSGQTYDGVDEARKAISQLDSAQVVADLDAAAAYVKKLPAASGTIAVAGFCWGGAKAFAYAAENSDLAASYVFYGTGPENTAQAESIACPVFGFYGENDARVTSTVAATQAAMKAAGRAFDPLIYAGAGHGFMRAGEDADATEANKKAHDDAWVRWQKLLGEL